MDAIVDAERTERIGVVLVFVLVVMLVTLVTLVTLAALGGVLGVVVSDDDGGVDVRSGVAIAPVISVCVVPPDAMLLTLVITLLTLALIVPSTATGLTKYERVGDISVCPGDNEKRLLRLLLFWSGENRGEEDDDDDEGRTPGKRAGKSGGEVKKGRRKDVSEARIVCVCDVFDDTAGVVDVAVAVPMDVTVDAVSADILLASALHILFHTKFEKNCCHFPSNST